jgi:hypothetical protein
VYNWSRSLDNYFENVLFPIHVDHGLALDSVNDGKVYCPVVPLMEANAKLALENSKSKENNTPTSNALISFRLDRPGGTLLGTADVNRLLDEEKRSLSAKQSEMGQTFPDAGGKVKMVFYFLDENRHTNNTLL